MKRLVMINSDKGGVGKTFTARVLGDVVRSVWKQPLAIYDADGVNGGTYRVHGLRGHDGKLVPDQDAVAGCGYFDVRDARDDGGRKFLECAAGGHASVLIDMPGGCSGALQDIVDDGCGVDGLVDALGDEGYRVTLLHLLTNDRASGSSVGLYLKMFGSAADHVVVKNGVCCVRASAESQFAHWTGGAVRAEFLTGGGVEIDLPAIHESVATRAADFKAPMSAMLTSSEVQIFERAQVKKLLKAAAEAFEPVRNLIVGG